MARLEGLEKALTVMIARTQQTIDKMNDEEATLLQDFQHAYLALDHSRVQPTLDDFINGTHAPAYSQEQIAQFEDTYEKASVAYMSGPDVVEQRTRLVNLNSWRDVVHNQYLLTGQVLTSKKERPWARSILIDHI